LNNAARAYQTGETDASRLRRIVEETVRSEPLARLQYASCADADTLQELQGPLFGKTLLSMAVFFGKTRLIDNLVLGG
jgi:pantoate--beta-alanine ligase